MARQALGTYDPTEVFVIFNGVIIDGYAPGTFIKVSRNEDVFSFQASNSGGGARSRNPNRSGRIEITLQTGSAANAFLSAFADADEQTGQGVGEFLVQDSATAAAECKAQNAWIVKRPDWERAKETGDVTWILESDDIAIAHDGLVPQA